jgi:hypothetical protein
MSPLVAIKEVFQPRNGNADCTENVRAQPRHSSPDENQFPDLM